MLDSAPTCARCGTAAAPGTPRCPSCQSYLQGHPGQRTHGLYAKSVPADLTQTADQLEQNIVADLGGVENLSALEKSIIRRLRDTEILLRLLANDIVKNGLHTPGGRVRQSYDKFLAGAALFDRLASRLGLKRRQKTLTPHEYWRAKQLAEQERDDA
jgi:ribosomal protein L34E